MYTKEEELKNYSFDQLKMRILKEVERPRVKLPLESYAKKQNKTVDNISQELKTGTHELENFDEKMRRASSQNTGNLSICG